MPSNHVDRTKQASITPSDVLLRRFRDGENPYVCSGYQRPFHHSAVVFQVGPRCYAMHGPRHNGCCHVRDLDTWVPADVRQCTLFRSIAPRLIPLAWSYCFTKG